MLSRGIAADEVVIETVSGERLVGRVLQEDGETVRFESSTLGEIRIPQAKIRHRTAPAPTAGGTAPGPVASQPPPPAAPASQATPAAPAPAAPVAKGALRSLLGLPDAVTASIAIGVNLRAGVIDQRGYTASLTVGYQGKKNVFNSVFQYQYMKAGPIRAADDFFFDNLFQHNFSEKYFLLVGGRYRQDKVMAVDEELNIFAAPGVYLIKNPKVEFGFAAGLSGLLQDFGSLAPGLPDPARTRDLGVATYQFLQYQALPRVHIVQNNIFTQSLDDSSKYIHRFYVSANIALTSRLSLMNILGRGYDSQPAPGVKKTQNMLMSQLGYQF